MKLLIDVGNTAIKIAGKNNNDFSFIGRFFVSELNDKKLDNLLSNCSHIDSVYIASVVPLVNKEIDRYFLNKYHIEPQYVKVGDYPALKIDIENNDELGTDLYCDLVGAYVEYGAKTLIVDLGTASKILLIDDTGTFRSCAIVPGLEMSKKVLSQKTALLPEVNSVEVKKLSECRNTIEVISSSVYYSHVEMVNGLLRRFEDEIGYKCHHVFTGGNAKNIIDNISDKYVLDEFLTLKGISEIAK